MKRLDHVGLVVADLSRSISWYEQVLRLGRLSYPKWKDHPVMLRGGKSAIALFQGEKPPAGLRQFFHFAFQVDFDQLQDFKKHFQSLDIVYRESDHHYFQSIYVIDPDGYEIELTSPSPI